MAEVIFGSGAGLNVGNAVRIFTDNGVTDDVVFGFITDSEVTARHSFGYDNDLNRFSYDVATNSLGGDTVFHIADTTGIVTFEKSVTHNANISMGSSSIGGAGEGLSFNGPDATFSDAVAATGLLSANGGVNIGSTINVSGVLDDDTFATASNTTLATSESIKAYVDSVGGAGVTDHGALTGLGDDDHTQYFLADGTRDITGNTTISKSAPTLYLEDTGGALDDKVMQIFVDNGQLEINSLNDNLTSRLDDILRIDMGTGEIFAGYDLDVTGLASFDNGIDVTTGNLTINAAGQINTSLIQGYSTSSLRLFGNSIGAGIEVYASDHATLADYIEFYRGGTRIAYWDDLGDFYQENNTILNGALVLNGPVSLTNTANISENGTNGLSFENQDPTFFSSNAMTVAFESNGFVYFDYRSDADNSGGSGDIAHRYFTDNLTIAEHVVGYDTSEGRYSHDIGAGSSVLGADTVYHIADDTGLVTFEKGVTTNGDLNVDGPLNIGNATVYQGSGILNVGGGYVDAATAAANRIDISDYSVIYISSGPGAQYYGFTGYIEGKSVKIINLNCSSDEARILFPSSTTIHRYIPSYYLDEFYYRGGNSVWTQDTYNPNTVLDVGNGYADAATANSNRINVFGYSIIRLQPTSQGYYAFNGYNDMQKVSIINDAGCIDARILQPSGTSINRYVRSIDGMEPFIYSGSTGIVMWLSSEYTPA